MKGGIAILKKVLHLDALSCSLATLSCILDAVSNRGFKVTDPILMFWRYALCAMRFARS